MLFYKKTLKLPKWRVGMHPNAQKSDEPMCFTAEALAQLLRTVGSREPESGAKGFGPKDRLGFDLIEFDVRGSEQAGGAVYSPDVEWGEKRRTHHLNQPEHLMRLWNGDLHSHPGGFGRPSRKAGPGLGDLGYVEEVFRANEWMQIFAIPIITFDLDGTIVINPWVCYRENVHSPRIAEFIVCDVEQFPERPFNPVWLDSLKENHTPKTVRILFEVSVPKTTPKDARVEIRGDHVNLGSWSGPGLPLKRTSTGLYVGSILMPHGESLEWKVTRGSWSTVEAHLDGSDTANRQVIATREQPCVGIVEAWADAYRRHPKSTSSQKVDAVTQGAHNTQSELPPPGQLLTEYTKRQKGLISDSFREKTILFIGLGAGSYMAEKIARLNPACIKTCDFDIVEASNLSRTSYTVKDIGHLKVSAFERRIRSVNPLIKVLSFTTSLTDMTQAELDELFDGVDLVVGGTDNFDAQSLVNTEAIRHKIPAIFIGIHARGEGGRVIWCLPGKTGCYRCAVPERYEAAESPTEQHELNLDGMVGTIIDGQFIDMVALKVAVAILERGQDSHYGRFYHQMKDRNDIVVRCHPNYDWGTQLWDALLADLPSTPKDYAQELKEEAFFAMDTVWLRGRHDPSCPLCASTTEQVDTEEKASDAAYAQKDSADEQE